MKKFSRQWYCKLAAFALIIVMAAMFIHSALQLIVNEIEFNVIQSRTYVESDSLYNDISRVTNNIMALGYGYGSAENIKNGNTVTDEEVLSSLYNDWQEGQYKTETDMETDTETTLSDSSLEIYTTNSGTEYWQNAYNYDSKFKEFISQHPKLVAKRRADLTQNDFEQLREIQDYLKSTTGFEYYVKIGKRILTNLDTSKLAQPMVYMEKLPLYMHMDPESKRIDVLGKNGNPYFASYSSGYRDKIEANDYLSVGINADYLKTQEKQWSEDRNLLIRQLVVMGIAALISLILFLYLCLVTGRHPEDDEVHLCLIDRMFSEFHILIGIFIFAFVFMVMEDLSYSFNRHQLQDFVPVFNLFLCASTAALMILVLSLIRSAKAKRFLNSFFCWRIFRKLLGFFVAFIKKIFDAIYNMFLGGSLMHKAVVIAVLVPVISATWFGVPFMIALLLYFSYRGVNRFHTIAEGVRRVKQGEVDYKIPVEGSGEFAELADDINSLSSGLGVAISAEVRSERLKGELISNVSHDIKTPLTSIITYIDLLKSEQIDNERAVEYIDVLDRKAQRLKVLTSDLFEAAKASSGSMNVNFEKVDVGALVRQGLGEMSDKISAVNLDFRVTMAEGSLDILADGRLMWRVLENLISNAVKYAQQGSRVYIDVMDEGSDIVLIMKNMSAYELNIPADELIERFKRGDESRNSEGSGLGLNIANSLTTLQKGSFKVEVDGDLFKATVCMPKFH